MTAPVAKTIHRGHVLFATRLADGTPKLFSYKDGALELSTAGTIAYAGPWNNSLAERAQKTKLPIQSWGDAWLIPGFVDTHIHFPQIDMIGSYGEDLLGWLSKYTFPSEQKFDCPSYSLKAAERFITALLRSGTTSSVVFSSSHFDATNILFETAARRGIKAVIGQTSMNRFAPDSLLVKDLEQHEKDFYTLTERWNQFDGRLGIAVTPRFAPSCTDDLLRLNASMAKEIQNALIQTHYAESEREVEWVKSLYPKAKDYLGVYEEFELISHRTILAHGIHVSEDEQKRLAKARAKISHCPSSNLFLGSGVMPWQRFDQKMDKSLQVSFALGSDVGAGTSFSLWRVMADAYKSQRLIGNSVSPTELFARATIDGHTMLSPQSKSLFSEGSDADFQVIDWKQCELMTNRVENGTSPEDLLFAMIWHWESAMTRAVYVKGRPVYENSDSSI